MSQAEFGPQASCQTVTMLTEKLAEAQFQLQTRQSHMIAFQLSYPPAYFSVIN